MKAKYSPSTGGVYPLNVHKAFPPDALDIPDSLYARFRAGEFSLFDVKNDVVVEYVTPPLSLNELKAAKREEMSSECHAAIIAGIDHDAYRYPTTEKDQLNLNGLVTRSRILGSGGEPYKFWCADINGNWVRRDHSAEQIQTVGLAVSHYVIAKQDWYASKLVAIAAASSAEDLDLIIWG